MQHNANRLPNLEFNNFTDCNLSHFSPPLNILFLCLCPHPPCKKHVGKQETLSVRKKWHLLSAKGCGNWGAFIKKIFDVVCRRNLLLIFIQIFKFSRSFSTFSLQPLPFLRETLFLHNSRLSHYGYWTSPTLQSSN